MFSNYFKVAVRNIVRHKFFSIINIIGLVIGMTCCLMIFIYVQDELSYDQFHKNQENIFSLALRGRMSGQELTTSNSSLPVGPSMKNEIPGIEEFLRLKPATYNSGYAIRFADKAFTEERIFFADSNFFTFFTFPLLKGDPATALREPNCIVITEALVAKYFGGDDPLGKTLVVGNDKIAVKVTGVAAEAPTNSHLHFQGVVSLRTVEKNYDSGWGGNSWHTYVRKTPTARVSEINVQLDLLVAKYFGKELEEGLGFSFDEFKKRGGVYSYYLYPLADIHLRSGLPDGIEPSGNITYVYTFAGVGIFILLIACINFMNLATAQSAGRAKEVGLRKTLGSRRGQMIGQFLSESFIYSTAAIILAVMLGYLMLPFFNLLTGKQLTMQALQSFVFLGVAFLLLVVVGLLAGSYPAFYMTSFRPVDVLKGKLRAGVKSKGVRSSLVVFQFAISTFLIIATVVVYEQLSFMQNKNLGFEKESVLSIAGTQRLGTNMNPFKNVVEGLPGVLVAGYTNNSFPGVSNTTVIREKGTEVDHLVGLYSADWDQMETMKMTLVEGRYFSREFKSDTLAVVINEAAAREYGFDNPLDKELTSFNDDKPTDYRVVGVVKDFNFETLKEKIRPLVIQLSEKGRLLQVRFEGDPRPVVAALEQHWKSMASGEPFEFSFLDANFDALFRSEMRLRDIFIVFSSLAILIACMGLFALAAFTTEQRTKEIGVRKAMGASVTSLTYLLSKEFTRLVLIAIIPAILGGWYVADWWLSAFTYRVELSPLFFLGSGLAAIVIAWVTVSFQSVKAASLNPVNSLRYE